VAAHGAAMAPAQAAGVVFAAMIIKVM